MEIEQNVTGTIISLPVAISVILIKGGIPKIWGETLLLLLLGIDY
jgi:hypothetical protein